MLEQALPRPPQARHPRAARIGGVVAGGLAVGVLTSFGQGWLDGPPSAIVNSASAWLVAPFVVGVLMPSYRSAATAGLVACGLQVASYYLASELRGFPSGGAIVVFWTGCAIIGGPVFGLAGRLWRDGPARIRGLGAATLAGAFLAEGGWLYLHVLDRPGTAALWFAVGAGIAVALNRRLRDLRWLVLTVSLGLLGEALLVRALSQPF